MELSNFEFVFDTSALVSFYDLDIENHKKLIETMKDLNIYIPEIVINELEGKIDRSLKNRFNINKLIDIKQVNLLKKSLKEAYNHLEKMKISSTELNETINKVNEISTDSLISDVSAILKTKKGEYINYYNNVEYPHKLIPFSYVDKLKSIGEAELRFKYKIPPGYKDKNKKSNNEIDKYNDFFIWISIIRYFKNKKKQVVFVTNDKKDTTKKENDLNSLQTEFALKTKSTISFKSSNDFFREILELNDILVLINNSLLDFIKNDVNDVIITDVLSIGLYLNFSGECVESYSDNLDLDDFELVDWSYISEEEIEFIMRITRKEDYECHSEYGEHSIGYIVIESSIEGYITLDDNKVHITYSEDNIIDSEENYNETKKMYVGEDEYEYEYEYDEEGIHTFYCAICDSNQTGTVTNGEFYCPSCNAKIAEVL